MSRSLQIQVRNDILQPMQYRLRQVNFLLVGLCLYSTTDPHKAAYLLLQLRLRCFELDLGPHSHRLSSFQSSGSNGCALVDVFAVRYTNVAVTFNATLSGSETSTAFFSSLTKRLLTYQRCAAHDPGVHRLRFRSHCATTVFSTTVDIQLGCGYFQNEFVCHFFTASLTNDHLIAKPQP